MQEEHVVIIDHIGRTIIGKQVSDPDSTTLTIDNPVILHCEPHQNGKLEVQTIPLFFFELVDKEHRQDNSWTYQRSNIVVSNVKLNPDIIKQYAVMNTPKTEVVVDDNPKVISIDDI